jgi:hypothetical protein
MERKMKNYEEIDRNEIFSNLSFTNVPKNPSESLTYCEEILEGFGINYFQTQIYADLGLDERVILMAEAVNMAAQEIDKRFELLKPLVVDLALRPGSQIRSWGGNDSNGSAVYHLNHRATGTVHLRVADQRYKDGSSSKDVALFDLWTVRAA